MKKENASNVSASLAALLGFACPACFPAVVVALGSIGFGFLASVKVVVPILFVFLIGGWFGLWLGYKNHKNIFPLLVSIVSGIMIPIARFVMGIQIVSYVFASLLIVAAVWNYLLLRGWKKSCKVKILEKNHMNTITCPYCDAKEEVEMPKNSCLAFHKCASCKKTIRPKGDDCCVFCSFGDAKCATSTSSKK